MLMFYGDFEKNFPIMAYPECNPLNYHYLWWQLFLPCDFPPDEKKYCKINEVNHEMQLVIGRSQRKRHFLTTSCAISLTTTNYCNFVDYQTKSVRSGATVYPIL